MDSLREAAVVAEVAHRRSGLPIEVHSDTGAVCLAFEPTRSTRNDDIPPNLGLSRSASSANVPAPPLSSR